MSRPNIKLEKYISLNEKIKKLTKEKDQIRSELIDGNECPMDIVGVDHYAVVNLRNRYICNISMLEEKLPSIFDKLYCKNIIKLIVYPTINYKPKVRKVA